MSVLDVFHPAVAAWFTRTFAAPTDAQTAAWPALTAKQHVLVAAPTGSGKTFAAFLAAIDELVREGLDGPLPDETRVVYVSPLKALSNDILRNLEAPLAGIRQELEDLHLPDVQIHTAVRTGDTTQAARASMRRRPPHIVVTTPESLYILMGSQSGRAMLSTCRTVIVDEIHAIAGNKRGAHLSLTLERLQALCEPGLVRVGLSATQKPIELVAQFLTGMHGTECVIADSGHVRRRDLELELPLTPLEPVMSGETWTEVYDRLAELVRAHRTTLIFVNTRRLVERVARFLSERLGAQSVAAHHGSLSKERRFDAEQRLKNGELQVLVATSSLELGIDIGDVDLVCQMGSTRSINALLQRVGRAGHAVGGISKGRLFPTSRDELIECMALLDAVRQGGLDTLSIPENALDVLAQQITAEVAAREWCEENLFAMIRCAYPYRNLSREEFDQCIRMLAEGFSTRRGRRSALLHHDAINHVLRPRKGARLTAITSGGAIPDNADYRVLMEPEGHLVGSVNEDFAVESLQGDIFQLGNTSYRILRVERGTVRVADAQGQPPSIPFWLGEAPGRSDELSLAVSGLRREFERSAQPDVASAARWIGERFALQSGAALQVAQYLVAGCAALGCLPTQETIVFERFFDEAGGMQLVIHSPFGSRINRAWGLALRKRFCRTFNFELQAAATEDHIVLSLTHAHSFELTDVARYLHSNTVRQVLVQAVCAAPMFAVRWRWGAGIALALPRFRGGKKIPPQIARMNAEDLLASVFPDQVACAENLPGEIEVPDHPLVRQTLRDCLEEAMDLAALERLLRGIESGAVRVVAKDLTQPSPLALEALNAKPYAYLDDAPLEERRSQAVMARRWLDPTAAADLGRLDADAILRVRAEAWPDATSADELHDALLWLTCLTDAEVQAQNAWPALLADLVQQQRALAIAVAGGVVWTAAERRDLFEPEITDASLLSIVRGRLQGVGPVSGEALASRLLVPAQRVAVALAALEAEGFAMRGRFTPNGAVEEWCERRLLARIHRYTVKRLRAEIEPVPASDFLRFLFDWQHVSAGSRMQGPDALAAILAQLEGYEAPAAGWEAEILPARVAEYEPAWLDEHCRAGRIVWTRLPARTARNAEGSGAPRGVAPIRATPIVLLSRRALPLWSSLVEAADPAAFSSRALAVADFIRANGASFYDEILEHVGLLPAEAEAALAELVSAGWVNADSFAGLRVLLMPGAKRHRLSAARARRRPAFFGMADAGRWAQVRRSARLAEEHESVVEHVVRSLLRRWGVIFWRLLAREAEWLPPWRELVLCCRRLEARGEIRGGRFVAGFSGEQYATPEAVAALRAARRDGTRVEPSMPHTYVVVSAADPLNLVGILTPGARIASLTGNRIVYRDALPVAYFVADEIHTIGDLSPAEQGAAHNALLRRSVPMAATGV